jgi:hypothetical protein
LSAETDAPALFLGPAPDAPVVGFLGKDVLVEVSGPSEQGRVPVRIRGGLWVRGYVPEELLVLRVQRHGRLRGTPVYLGPNDAVNLLGPGEKAGRVRVRAIPRVPGYPATAYEGTYPEVGVAAHVASQAEPLPEGEPQVLLVNTALALYDKPDGTKLVELPPQRGVVHVRVLSRSQGWAAVRVGDGPYLAGYTKASMVPGPVAPAPGAAPPSSGVPRRLAQENGELKRVAAGARVSFGERVIARLHDAGLARVLTTYPSGEVDALIAVNEEVTVRGLLHASDLSPTSAPPTETTARSE